MNNSTTEGYWEILQRRKFLLIIPFLLVFTVTSAIGFLLPKIYRANTLIMVEAPKVPREYVQSLVTTNTEEWLDTIREHVRSRSLLGKVIEEYSLDHVEPSRAQKIIKKLGFNWERLDQKSQEATISEIRKRIGVETVGGRKSRVVAFSIFYEGLNPETVMNVTNRITGLFIQNHLETREEFVQGASEFLETELNRLRGTLEEEESKISEFKRIYNGVLPSQLDANLRALDRFQTQMEVTNLDIKEIEARIALINKVPLSNEFSLLIGLQPEEVRLLELRRKLSALQNEYTDSYPDIAVVQAEIKGIEDQQVGSAQSPKGSVSPPERHINRKSNLLLQQEEGKLKRQIDYRDSLLSKIRAYERRVEQIPLHEQKLAVLIRDYENTQENYRSLLSKSLNAKISENLEKQQKGEVFRILDTAVLPASPFKPDLRMFILLGLVGGLASGVGMVIIREQIDTSFHNPEDLARTTGFVVIAEVPSHIRVMVDAPSELL